MGIAHFPHFDNLTQYFELYANCVESKHFNFSRVVDCINDDYKKWHPLEPVFIDAPTGTGKTTFVYQKLIRDAIAEGRGVLIVSNRIALSMQQKRHIYEIIKKDAPHLLGELREENITPDTHLIGPVCVTTYQGMYGLFNPDPPLMPDIYTHELAQAVNIKIWSISLKYAVFDEAHFFYADAEFNEFCHILLRYIPYVFRDVIRIYMTATSWDVLEYIKKYETQRYSYGLPALYRSDVLIDQFSDRETIYSNQNTPPHKVTEFHPLHLYSIESDYSGYSLKFFKSARNSGSDNSSEFKGKVVAVLDILKRPLVLHKKAVIFVDNKSEGKSLFRELIRNNISAIYIDRQESVPKNAKSKIIETERFDESVLITTSVIDCGINLCDDDIKTIVIFYTDRTQFMQALGRKRMKSGETGVDVWAFVPSEKSFKRQVQGYDSGAENAMKLMYALYAMRYNYPDYFSMFVQMQNDVIKELTFNDYNYFLSLANRPHCKSFWNKYFYPILAKEFYDKRPEPVTLTYMNNGTIECNFYVLGVILRKMNFLKQFVFPDKDGLIKDYREVVGEWLGKPNILEEISRENEAAIQSERAELEKLLYALLERELTDKDFDPIRAAIITAHINAFPNSELKKRNSEYKHKMGDKALSRLLSKLGMPYEISSRRKNSGGKNNSVWHTWKISRL